ncbi:MAG: hypothetical protein E7598_07485 [Ruminococcaceae bacterium]|nr:hypothetical protein [Oscillospiraceae bacterium]
MKIKNLATTIVFSLLVFGFSLLCIFHPIAEYSDSERRPLAQFPNISVNSVLDGTAIKGFDDYSVDQFPFREQFRKLYMWYRFNINNIGEANGYAESDGVIVKIDSELNQVSLDRVVAKFNDIYEKLLKDKANNVYLSVIPDKNYFYSKIHGNPALDYEKFVAFLTENLSEMEYIDIFDTLELDDYYKTDTHWSQDKILAVRDKIAAALGVSDSMSEDYTVNSLENFSGVLLSQSLIDVPKDTIHYLTNDVLDGCTVTDYERGKTLGIYDLAKYDSKEPYDIFLSGTKSLLRIDNPAAKEKKEIVIFRDSFGSSLIPLLAEGYSSIYIVDIRYVASGLLGNMIDFENKDVLFIYSTLILNSNPDFK